MRKKRGVACEVCLLVLFCGVGKWVGARSPGQGAKPLLVRVAVFAVLSETGRMSHHAGVAAATSCLTRWTWGHGPGDAPPTATQRS
jgi:hypothetical protein